MTAQQARYLDDVELGDELPKVSLQPTTNEIVRFCELWGNPPPNRFTDAEIAKKARLPGPIIPGVMSMGFMARIFTGWASNAQVRKMDVVFRQFIVHNVPLEVVAIVTDKDESAGVITCDVNLQTADGQRLITGQAFVGLPRKGR
jgi:acyl dehydratase